VREFTGEQLRMDEMTGLLVSSQTSQKRAAQNKLQLNKSLIFVTILKYLSLGCLIMYSKKKFPTMNSESSNALLLMRALILQREMTPSAISERLRRR